MAAVAGGLVVSFEHISREVCITMHERHAYYLSDDVKITDLQPNSTTTGSVVTAGSLNVASDSSGATYNIRGNVYYAVVVQAAYEITLRDGVAVTDLEKSMVHMPSGTSASYSKGHMIDLQHGHTFWSATWSPDCSEAAFDVIYDGPATKTYPVGGGAKPIVIVENQDSTFSWKLTEPVLLCQQHGFKTESSTLCGLGKRRTIVL